MFPTPDTPDARPKPMPAVLSESLGADRGLICGYRLRPNAAPQEIPTEEVASALVQAQAGSDAVVWLHFNLSDARARRWLLDATFLPEALRELWREHDGNRRVELVDDGGLLLVVNDFSYDDASDPSEVAPLWCFASQQLLITARLHPLRSADELRLQMRSYLTASSGIELAAQLLDIRTSRVKRLANEMTDQLDTIEDRILAGKIEQQRELLGRNRRLCARLRRQFAPERSDLNRFLHRPAGPLSAADREALQSSTDTLAFALEEISELYERAKLLQEELASRLAENTGRNLYVLSIVTAVMLPMTLVTGIFGMNVGGLPGLHGGHAFWWVMLLIVASGAVTLAAFFWRRLL
ncbi:CorA family divalent cation transporter [Peristeroidobacter agariperforans]|uniref:CorA family divalent cation transporter n=1 Tax=Peristeroidobacter agariperforans TaxID=268404 RepID=UPI00101D9D12|nr:CorA family divalent cation transporter [Peristeroidobacter agariperforans]